MRILIIASLFLQSVFCFAQATDSIRVVTFNTKDKVLIKWLPENYELWMRGMKQGYIVERYEVEKVSDKWKVVRKDILTPQPVKPWSRDKIRASIADHPDLNNIDVMLAGEDLNTLVPEGLKESADLQGQKQFVFALGLFSLVHKNIVAEAMGSYLVDSTAKPGKTFLYKVKLNQANGGNGEAIVNRAIMSATPKITGFSLVGVHKGVDLFWLNQQRSGYIYYDIYRSASKNKDFIKVNDAPYIGEIALTLDKNRVKFTDSVPELGKTYYYKVVGINAFEKESPPTEPLPGIGAYFLQKAPVFTKGESENNLDVSLEWQVYADEKPYVKGFSLFHATSPGGNFIKLNKDLLKPDNTSFKDLRKDKGSSNYYTICGYGAAGDSVCSVLKGVFLIDSIPPAPPVIVSGVCDTNGVVTLTWKKGPEADILGYRIFRTYYEHKEPNRITVEYITDTILTDSISLKSGFRKVFYGVAAIDQHYNASPLSIYFPVAIPDKIPPVNAFFKDFITSYSGINLVWKPSPSDDIKTQYLYRKSELEFQWQKIGIFRGDSLKVSSYRDTLTKSNLWYEYALVAEDSSGLTSKKSDILRIKQPEKNPFPVVKNLRGIVSKENKMVKLSWEFNMNATGFKIMRGKKGEPLETYTFIEGSKREFYDKFLTTNTEYIYSVVAEVPEGRQSLMSNKIEVKY